MDISISNIAWDVSLDDEVAKILQENDVNIIDVAPTKYLSSLESATYSDIRQIKKYWNNKEIEFCGMQSLLFGTNGLNVFGDKESQNQMLKHLSKICEIGDILDARKLVFGSPRNRDKGDLSKTETDEVALAFFNKLGNVAKKHNVQICLEPNPEIYNANFLTNSFDTFDFVTALNHSNVEMQLDIGAMQVNNEDAADVIYKVCGVIGHIHISEPKLVSLVSSNDYHLTASEELKKHLSDKVVTIEMLTQEGRTLDDIKRSVQFTNKYYR